MDLIHALQDFEFSERLIRFLRRRRTREENTKANTVLNRQNLFPVVDSSRIAGQSSPERSKILFVADYLAPYGGVESRLNHIAEDLAAHNWEVIFLTEGNNFNPLKNFRNYTLKFHAENFGTCLTEIVRTHQINIVEFQFKYSGYLRFVDIHKLRQVCMVGCTVHGYEKCIKNIPLQLLSHFDYRICISSLLLGRYENFPSGSFSIIRNCIEPRPRLWNFHHQKMAIHISRLSYEYESRITGFVDFCIANNISFEIAGDRESENAKKFIGRLQRKLNLPPSVFVGRIDTVPFLKENISRYLFVAGCGNVALEAGSIGYPVFVTSSTRFAPPVFLAADNIDYFRNNNFTIRKARIKNHYPPVLDSKNSMEETSVCIHQFLTEHRNLQQELAKYREILRAVLAEDNIPRQFGKQPG